MVQERDSSEGVWGRIGETEILSLSNEPAFVKPVVIQYAFEVQQRLRLVLCECTTTLDSIEIAECFCTVAQIVASKWGVFEGLLKEVDQKTFGTLFVSSEESGRPQTNVSMEFFLAPTIRLSAPSLMLCRTNPRVPPEDPGHLEPIYRTFPGKLSRNFQVFTYPCLTVRAQQLARRDEDRPAHFILFDKGRRIGQAITCLRDLKRVEERGEPMALVFRSDLSGSSLKESDRFPHQLATLHITTVSLKRELTFLDYVLGGLEISLLVAIDFTLSNGDVTEPESLHFLGGDGRKSKCSEDNNDGGIFHGNSKPGKNGKLTANEYLSSLRAVGEILEFYDSDKKFPVYGFGGRLPPNYSATSQCFALNGNFFSPEVEGIQGAEMAYRESLRKVCLHGPSELAPILKIARKLAIPDNEKQKYNILLIITDGGLSDFEKCVDEIIELAELPISIVIVGVGDGQKETAKRESKFHALQKLDADKDPLISSSGKRASRDIVQFVPFSDFKNKSQQELAVATLAEIPREVVGFFRTRNFQPSEGEKTLNPKKNENRSLFKPEKQLLIDSVVRDGYQREYASRVVNAGIAANDKQLLIDLINCNTKSQSLAKRQGKPAEFKGSFDCGLFAVDGEMEINVVEKKSEISLCLVCVTRLSDRRLKPCGHILVCSECVNDLGVVCPLCRATIDLVDTV